MENPRFTIFKSSANSQYYFNLKSANGEKILSSEGYTTKQNCQNGIATVRLNAPYDSRYDRKDASSNYTFNLKSSNGEIIGRSENYISSAGRENGISAVKRDAPNALTEDLT